MPGGDRDTDAEELTLTAGDTGQRALSLGQQDGGSQLPHLRREESGGSGGDAAQEDEEMTSTSHDLSSSANRSPCSALGSTSSSAKRYLSQIIHVKCPLCDIQWSLMVKERTAGSVSVNSCPTYCLTPALVTGIHYKTRRAEKACCALGTSFKTNLLIMSHKNIIYEWNITIVHLNYTFLKLLFIQLLSCMLHIGPLDSQDES